VVGAPFNSSELARIAERGRGDKIVMAGKVNDTELNLLYGHARFFFFPSLYEGLGIPPLEAMQAGCPVLASNRSSVPEVIGDAGILFDPGDIETVRSGLSSILDEQVVRGLIESGKKRVAEFSWNSIIDAYADLYESLLGA
jgi:glycosyltransferase involved in cell wall biosynthesis